MRWEVGLVLLVAALGTYALRYLPILASTRKPGPRLSRFLSATGPAAIAALAVASYLPEIVPDWHQLAPLAGGTAGVVLAFLWKRDVAIATMGGAIAYGVVFALVGA